MHGPIGWLEQNEEDDVSKNYSRNTVHVIQCGRLIRAQCELQVLQNILTVRHVLVRSFSYIMVTGPLRTFSTCKALRQ